MDIDKELENVFSDPLLNLSHEETELFDMPEDMKTGVRRRREQPDYVAQREVCQDFEDYRSMFLTVHKDLSEGKRSLVRVTKTTDLLQGHFYLVSGQMLFLERIIDEKRSSNGLQDGRTRCIYENGTESDILLQTLRKNVVGDGFAITETEEETEKGFFNMEDLTQEDNATGYIYVLQSLSDNQEVANIKDLYKIGFTEGMVKERIKNAANDPTYLMAPVKVVCTYKVVNLNPHKFETLLHRVFSQVNCIMKVTDDAGVVHSATEWYVVPIGVIDRVVDLIATGEIIHYTYNKEQKCLEKIPERNKSKVDLSGLKVLTLNIKKQFFDLIIKGEKKEEYRQLKQTTLNKYTYLDETDGKRRLRRYDVLRLFVGYHKDRESAVVEVLDITFEEGVVIYHLGRIIELNT